MHSGIYLHTPTKTHWALDLYGNGPTLYPLDSTLAPREVANQTASEYQTVEGAFDYETIMGAEAALKLYVSADGRTFRLFRMHGITNSDGTEFVTELYGMVRNGKLILIVGAWDDFCCVHECEMPTQLKDERPPMMII